MVPSSVENNVVHAPTGTTACGPMNSESMVTSPTLLVTVTLGAAEVPFAATPLAKVPAPPVCETPLYDVPFSPACPAFVHEAVIVLFPETGFKSPHSCAWPVPPTFTCEEISVIAWFAPTASHTTPMPVGATAPYTTSCTMRTRSGTLPTVRLEFVRDVTPRPLPVGAVA